MSPADPPGTGTLVFLQGTGDPDPVPAETIRSMLARDPVLSHFTVLNVAWEAGGAPDISVVPSLPPRYRQETAAVPPEPDTGRALALAGLDVHSAPPLYLPAVPVSPPGTGTGPAPETPANPQHGDTAPRENTPSPDAMETLLGSTLERLTLNLVTDVAVRRRVPLMAAASDFSRSIVFYLRRGAEARAAITEAIGTVDRNAPVILFGHSLGSVAAVDLVSSPEWQAGGLRADLLVTAGSQSSWLCLLGGLTYLGPHGQGSIPVPWLNFWDERDLLSFCAERVFAGRGARIADREVVSGEPFPASHSAYFSNPEVYSAIREELAALSG